MKKRHPRGWRFSFEALFHWIVLFNVGFGLSEFFQNCRVVSGRKFFRRNLQRKIALISGIAELDEKAFERSIATAGKQIGFSTGTVA